MGNLLALAAALFFGTGDFAGGMASRKASPWQVLFAGNALSVIILTIAAGFLGEPAPAGRGLLFPFLAGSAGAIGLVSLYRGLAMGRAALVSPLSGVIAAGLPVLVSAARDGLPGFWQLAGFALAIPGIWLVSQTADRDSRAHARGALLMGVLAGISFGLFYVLIAMVPHDALFGPMAIIKLAGAAIAAFVLLWGKFLPACSRELGDPAAASLIPQPTCSTRWRRLTGSSILPRCSPHCIRW